MIERLYPDPKEVREVYEDVEIPAGAGLPYVIVNMVSSLDGRVALAGSSSSIGSPTDRKAMRLLRSRVDAVMVGSETLRSETLSLTSEGRKNPEPLAVIPTLSLNLPLESNLKNSPRERTFVLTTRRSAERANRKDPQALQKIKRRARILTCAETSRGAVDLDQAFRDLETSSGVERLLLEGGPELNGAVISQGLADEIFLTLSPKLLSGPEDTPPGIVSGIVSGNLPDLRLKAAYRAESELFLRYELPKPCRT